MQVNNRCNKLSNSYYNLGLEKAKIRNLSAAITYLKTALKLNKNNTDARNLLGLVYFEIGETAEALVQWVISTNLKPDDNDANIYLSKLRKKPGQLDINEQNIIKFNQALNYVHTGNEDLAQITLNRIVEEKPKYVKALLLLSLLYIRKESYTKARKTLAAVLRIDRYNTLALQYLNEVKLKLMKPEQGKNKDNKNKNIFSHNQMQDDEVIIPSTYKEYTGWQTVVNIGAGLIIGAASIFFLYIPTMTARLNSKHNSELIAISEKLSNANNEVSTLSKSNTELKSENERLTSESNSNGETTKNQIIQYQKLVGLVGAMNSKKISEAAIIYATMDSSQIVDIPESGVSVKAVYNEIASRLNVEGYKPLLTLGDTSMAAKDYNTAISYYDMAISIKPDYVEAMYKKATAYKASGNEDAANGVYNEIISKFPNSEYATKARTDRGF